MTLDESDAEVAEEQIVQTVLHRGVRTVGAELNFESIVLSYGMKQLTVFIDDANATIDTKVETAELENPQKPRETNILYKAAKLFMQEAMNRRRSQYKYTFTTRNPKMLDWARGSGDEIFHWTRPGEPVKGNDSYFVFETTFKPEHYEPDQKVVWE